MGLESYDGIELEPPPVYLFMLTIFRRFIYIQYTSKESVPELTWKTERIIQVENTNYFWYYEAGQKRFRYNAFSVTLKVWPKSRVEDGHESEKKKYKIDHIWTWRVVNGIR